MTATITPSPALATVLDAVRATGVSAHAPDGEVSNVVLAAAMIKGVNPVDLQDEVRTWADALDAGFVPTRVAS